MKTLLEKNMTSEELKSLKTEKKTFQYRPRDESGRFLPTSESEFEIMEESPSKFNEVIQWEPLKGKNYVYIRCQKLSEDDKDILLVAGVMFIAAIIF